MIETLITRLKKRAEIRRQISTRKSVQEGKADRIADLLEEAAHELGKHLGAECSDPSCPDYDGNHPYHFNAVELFWDRVQDSYNDAAAPGKEVPAAVSWGKLMRKQEERIYELEQALGNHPTLRCYPGAHDPANATGPCEECEWEAYVRLLLGPQPERCGAVSQAQRGVPDGRVCKLSKGHESLFHQDPNGAMWWK